MAKDSFLLFGSRGKIGNVVSYKGEKGSTVHRIHVIPRNPRTIKQMQTRIAFGTAATAAKLLLPIIGQTFQGFSGEKLNRREFMRMNTTRMIDYIRTNQGIVREAHQYCFNPKNGNQAVVPNPWVIANGTLDQAPWGIATTGTQGEDTFTLDGITFGGGATLTEGETYTGSDLVRMVFGIVPGTQVTIVGIVCRNANPIIVVDNTEVAEADLPNAGIDILKASKLCAARLVTQASETSITIAAGTTAAQIQAVLLSAIDADKTSQPFIGLVEAATYSGGAFALQALDFDDLFGFDSQTDTILSAGIITSYFDKIWKYSPSIMTNVFSVGEATDDGSSDPTRYGFNFDNAILSYLGYSNEVSNLYTQQGGLVNNIGNF